MRRWIETVSGRQSCIVALLFALYAPFGVAQTDDHDVNSSEAASSHASAHRSHQNVLSFFAGATHGGVRKNAPALGVGYERLLPHLLGIGVLAEHTFGDADVSVYAVPFSYRIEHWKFYVAPGIEESDAHGTESLVRLSAEYAFETDSWD